MTGFVLQGHIYIQSSRFKATVHPKINTHVLPNLHEFLSSRTHQILFNEWTLFIRLMTCFDAHQHHKSSSFYIFDFHNVQKHTIEVNSYRQVFSYSSVVLERKETHAGLEEHDGVYFWVNRRCRSSDALLRC